jgi:hypothetical protein
MYMFPLAVSTKPDGRENPAFMNVPPSLIGCVKPLPPIVVK